MSQQLREYQSRAIEALRAEFRAGKRRALLVSPTGSGKTTVAAAMIHSAVGMGKRVLFLAHRKELIDQVSARLDGVGVDHGVIQSGHPRSMPGFPVQVASVQTLVRRSEMPDSQLIVIDEAHHARATTYQSILDRFPTAPVIGLTATPWRSDGRGLGELFDSVVVAARPAELIAQGHLVNYTGFGYDVPDLSSLRSRAGDYAEEGLEMVMGSRKIVGNIVEQYQAHSPNALAVLFAVSIRHSLMLRDRFLEVGIAAEHIDGTMPIEQRTAILRRLAQGTTRVLTNCNVVTEGWDLPALEVCILARPTKSAGLYLQCVGRVMRPSPSTGKTIARIHDHAGCMLDHGLPDEDRDYSLDADKKRERTEKPLRTCKQCLRIYEPSLGACPACGLLGPSEPRALPDEVHAEPVPIEQIKQHLLVRRADESRFLAELRTTARERGYKPKWVGVQFKSRYGRWPGRTA